ncbi:PREDICTED: tripartite motif-containing protein 2-like [Priapulus caudatus]|uniref:Tripartite motif-containing protein 2-like n=1 Tax=Priapulus caudatus TaxID=37621 RepID=A0ABM1E729_PRICU|nr:PREDICTED: tripartite motif-containing protein 2-like [Priapulus caudatus]
MAAGGSLANVKFMQEIVDEFLSCAMCGGEFIKPKTLSCLHTFCEKCLRDHVTSLRGRAYGGYRDLPCPTCRKYTALPLGGVACLLDNFFVTSLGEVVRKRGAGKASRCEFCRQLKETAVAEATSRCLDCEKRLCGDCADAHRRTRITAEHVICDADTPEQATSCDAHVDEVARYYCDPCGRLVCVLCTLEQHAGHEVSALRDGVGKYRRRLDQLLAVCRTRLEELREQLADMQTCSIALHETETRVRAHARRTIEKVRADEERLVARLRRHYGRAIAFLDAHADVSDAHERLAKNCKLADSLRCKDIEFLVVRKELERALQTQMDDDEVRPTPETAHRKFEFIEGHTCLGRIRNPYESSDSEEDDEEEAHGTPSSGGSAVDAAVSTDVVATTSCATQTTGLKKSSVTSNKKKATAAAAAAAAAAVARPPSQDQSTQLPEEKQQKIRIAADQGLAILPNGDLVVIDAHDNKLAILDKRGRFRYTFGSDQLTCPSELHRGNVKDYTRNGDRHVKIYTPHGYLLNCLDDELISCLPLGLKVDEKTLFK